MSNNLHFETLQLHAGQQIDPTTNQGPCLFIKLLRMGSTAQNMPLICSDSKSLEIFIQE